MKKYSVIVTERSVVSFEVDAPNKQKVKELIFKFYNGFDEDTEDDLKEEMLEDLSVDFLDWKIDDIQVVK